MKILITGGSGFLGSALTYQLLKTQLSNTAYQVTWVSRSLSTTAPTGVQVIDYNELASTNQHFDIVINLAGAGIADKRWSNARKQVLFDSRLNPTQAVLDYIARIDNKPELFVSGSAIGWYGAQTKNNAQLTEDSPSQTNDFAHSLCKAWEQLALSANQFDVPVAIIRTGVVISPTGGMITKLKTPFSLGVGGNLGNGKQIMSWISLADWVNAVLFIIENNQHTTSNNHLPNNQCYNLTAPNPITNSDFTKAVGHWLNRPTVFHQPAFMVKQLFGKMATLLIDGQNVYPQNLLDMGFEFEHGSVGEALNAG